VCSYSAHIPVKFCEFWCINLGFITKKLRSSHFPQNILGANSAKTSGWIPKQLHVEKMVWISSIHMPSLVEIGSWAATGGKKKQRCFYVCLFLSMFVSMGVAYFRLTVPLRCAAPQQSITSPFFPEKNVLSNCTAIFTEIGKKIQNLARNVCARLRLFIGSNAFYFCGFFLFYCCLMFTAWLCYSDFAWTCWRCTAYQKWSFRSRLSRVRDWTHRLAELQKILQLLSNNYIYTTSKIFTLTFQSLSW